MRGLKPSVAVAALAVVGLALWARAFVDPTASQMATSADRWLAALTDEQRARASFEFDSPERFNWHFIPRERKGLPIKEMTPAQRALVFGLINSGVGAAGYLKATTIMSLEEILRELEQGRQGTPVRDPERYFVSIFGKPSDQGRWGWRVEGHHLSLNFVLENGAIVSATPAFFGANPAEVRSGPRQGLRTLADIEDRALRLVQALDADQQKQAILASQAPPEIRKGTVNTPQPPTDAAEGIAYADLKEDQRAMLRALVETYALDMPPSVAQAWLKEIKDSGPESIKFAWFGPPSRNEGHAYRVQGPSFLIEFNNTQNNANHIHSVWRNMLGDFGIPLKGR
jgi:hypothetical protein